MAPGNSIPIITMRATQRKRISRAVVRKLVGEKGRSPGVWSGQPRVAKGQSAELNQVSRTSSSCTKVTPSQAGHFVGATSATIVSSQSPQYQTGIWWPHQSWRETHQGRISFIQLR